MSPSCPKCNKPLEKVRYPSDSMLNRDQWESVRAGDWLCECHNNGRSYTPYAYFWDHEVGGEHVGHPEGGETSPIIPVPVSVPKEVTDYLAEVHKEMDELTGVTPHQVGAPSEGISAEQFYMYKWRDEHANQTIDWSLMREFAEAYAALKVREATQDVEMLTRVLNDARKVMGRNGAIEFNHLETELAKLREERDALTTRCNVLSTDAELSTGRAERAESALAEAREALNRIGFTEQHLPATETARKALNKIDKIAGPR